MRAGSLDRSIFIRRSTDALPVPNAYGVLPKITNTGQHMRAELLDTVASDEAHESGHVTKTVLSFRLRYLADVKPGDKLEYDGRQFEIQTVKEIGRRKGLELSAIERPV